MAAVLREETMQRLLDRLYQRLGARYPRYAVAAVPLLGVGNVVLGVVAVALFTDLSAAEFWRILGVGVALMALYSGFYVSVAFRVLGPIQPWLEGDRSEDSVTLAWSTCAAFPRTMMRNEWASPLLGGLSYSLILAWTAYTTWQLGLSVWEAIPLAAGIMGAFIIYVQLLRFFALEQVLRPVLADIAAEAVNDVELFAPGFPLRRRLLAALPAINVVTGVAAVGIVGAPHGVTLSDLGFAVGVSVAIAGTISLALTALLADSVTSPIVALRQGTKMIAEGDFTARVPVVTTDETGDLTRSFNEMAVGLEQRERLRDAFGAFVDPSLVERVARDGTDFRGEEVEVSIMFMDVRGFTTLSERSTPREVVGQLNVLYDMVVPVIVKHGGHANKFIGDGLLAVFGAPVRHEDHPERAVAAALEIAEKVGDGAAGDLRVGLGVNSGTVVVGTIGGGGRLDFTVIGDVVNTAARVESATRQTGDDVLITEATLSRLAAGSGDWDERPAMALKGKSRDVQLYAPKARVGQLSHRS
jgi:adenylate cyclase